MSIVRFSKIVLLTLGLISSHVFAAPVSDASVAELLSVMHTEANYGAIFDAATSQVNAAIDRSIQQCLQCSSSVDGQKAIMDQARVKLLAMMRSELSYRNLESKIIEIYKSEFSEEDIQGLIHFYRTPLGQRLIAKLPEVTQKSNAASQQLMAEVIPKILPIMLDAQRQINANRMHTSAVTPPIPASPSSASQAIVFKAGASANEWGAH